MKEIILRNIMSGGLVRRGRRLLLFLALWCGEESTAEALSLSAGKEHLTVSMESLKWNRNPAFDVEKNSEKTPDGQPALRIQWRHSGGNASVSGKPDPAFADAIGKIDAEPERISFWFKPDGSGEKVTLLFSSVDSSGNPLYHSFKISLIGDGWQKIEISRLFSREKKPLRINELRNIYFYGNPARDISFDLGPIEICLKDSPRLEPVNTLEAFPFGVPPKLDGVLDDPCWSGSAAVTRLVPDAAAPVRVMTGYDKDNIYIGFSQETDTRKLKRDQGNPDGTVWADDSFQVLFSPGDDNRTYHQFIVNSLNVRQTYHHYFDQVKDDFATVRNLFAGQWDSAVKVEDRRWSAELRIPRRLIPEPESEPLHGFQILVSNPSMNQNCFWSPSPRSGMPSNFGVLVLGKDSREKEIPSPGIRGMQLFFGKDEPRLLVTAFSGESGWKLDARLSTPAGKIFRMAGTCGAFSVMSFSGFMPQSGVQRLTVRVTSPDGHSTFEAFRANMIFARNLEYGTTVLNPKPKEILWKTSAMRMTGREKIFYGAGNPEAKRTAEKIRDDLSGYLQTVLVPEESSGLKPEWIVIAVAPQTPSAATLPDKSGAYSLEIREDAVILNGRDPAGLFYAAATLSQLERYALLRNEESLKGVVIRDWPELPHRIWKSWSDARNSVYTPNTRGADTPEEILAVHYDYLTRLAIGSKMNFFSLQSPTAIRYENPETKIFAHRNAFLTPARLGELADYCRRHYVEFAPALNGPSHAHWLTDKFPELIMPGYNHYDADPTNPEFFKRLFGIYGELIAATKPAYFDTWLDEWWHKPTGPVSSQFKGREKREIYLETVLKIHDYFQSRGIRMMMFSDMLQRGHNGGKPYDNYLNADKLPKDIIVCTWGQGGAAAARQFAELGHISWYIGNLYPQIESAPLKGCRNFTGLGVINYDSITPDYGYGAAGMLRTADRSWNFWTDSGASLEDWLYENGSNVMPMYGVMPNPRASREFVTLNFSTLCNDSYAHPSAGKWRIDGLPQGETKIGFIPARINPSASPNIIRGGETPVAVPVGLQASSLIFLHTQYCPPEKQKAMIAAAGPRRSGSYHGLKTGVYTVVYADGGRLPVYVRNSVNCGNWQPFRGRIVSALNNKYLIDARYVWEGAPVNGQETCLYQYEWVNPRPDVPIERIEFASMGTEAVPYLFALTARKVKP